MDKVPTDVRNLWSNATAILPSLVRVATQLDAVGWNFDFECDGTGADFELYLSFLSAVNKNFVGLGSIVDANGDGCTQNYTAMAEHSGGLVLDMSEYYETWPGVWVYVGACLT